MPEFQIIETGTKSKNNSPVFPERYQTDQGARIAIYLHDEYG